MRALLGIDQNVVRAVSHDIGARELNPLTVVAAYHQGSALYNKGAELVNVPGKVDSIVNKLDGNRNHTDLPQLPSVDLQKFAIDQGNKYVPTYKSHNG